jgi:hypothetical protein
LFFRLLAVLARLSLVELVLSEDVLVIPFSKVRKRSFFRFPISPEDAK